MSSECPVLLGPNSPVKIDFMKPRPSGEHHPEVRFQGNNKAAVRAITPISQEIDPKRTIVVVRNLELLDQVARGGSAFSSESDDPIAFTGADLGGKVGGTLGTDVKKFRQATMEEAFNPHRMKEATRAGREIAEELINKFKDKKQIDFRTYAEDFSNRLLLHFFGLPQTDEAWMDMKTASAIAFGPVPSLDQKAVALRRWEESDIVMQRTLRGEKGTRGKNYKEGVIYLEEQTFQERRKNDADFTEEALVRTLDTGYHGGPALWPVMMRGGILLMQNPHEIQNFLRDPKQGTSYVLINEQFPVLARRRVTKNGIMVGNIELHEGDLIMASDTAAIHDPKHLGREYKGVIPSTLQDIYAKSDLAFGRYGHYCTGAKLTRAGIAVGLGTFFEIYPHARLTYPELLTFGGGTLSFPTGEVPVDLGRRAA